MGIDTETLYKDAVTVHNICMFSTNVYFICGIVPSTSNIILIISYIYCEDCVRPPLSHG